MQIKNASIILIQLWIGKIPDYFWYHYETTKNLDIDFLFVTDQDLELNSRNYKVIKVDIELLEKIIKSKIGIDYKINNLRNVCILKSSLGDLFSEHLNGYDFFGHYDIDTLFGDLRKFVDPHLESFDVVSFGEKNYHDRISGPLTIIRNTEQNRTIYKTKFAEFVNNLINYDVTAFDENELNELHQKNSKVKLLYDCTNFDSAEGKLISDSKWFGGKVYVNSEEKLLHHFYNKKNTKLNIIGNTITCTSSKSFSDDFVWVTYFTENYEKLLEGFIDSIRKYSNRKCILYTINYTSDLIDKLDEQFIVRRLDLPKGDLDVNGRDITVLSSKPIILSDAIDYLTDAKFIYLDTDVYLTNVADDLGNFFDDIENYPLMNSHVHDRLYANDISPTREWVSTLDILSEATNIPIKIFPRRKCNVILFDKNSKWFFEEQMEIYYKHKNTKPGIFRLHDEDSANILLSKYEFKKSLPLIDMEESPFLDMQKIQNYSYNISLISEHVKLPKNENEIYIFHGFKDFQFHKKIREKYGKTVLCEDDFLVIYKNNTLLFQKNSFLSGKLIEDTVDFVVRDSEKKEILNLQNQKIFNYWIFYISSISLNHGKYYIDIIEKNKNRIIYKTILYV